MIVGKLDEDLVDLRAELSLDDGAGLAVGERRHVRVQLTELRYHLRSEEVDARTEHLPELHERGPEPLERLAQPLGELRVRRRLLLAVFTRLRRRPLLDEVVETFFGEDPGDLRDPADSHGARLPQARTIARAPGECVRRRECAVVRAGGSRYRLAPRPPMWANGVA